MIESELDEPLKVEGKVVRVDIYERPLRECETLGQLDRQRDLLAVNGWATSDAEEKETSGVACREQT